MLRNVNRRIENSFVCLSGGWGDWMVSATNLTFKDEPFMARAKLSEQEWETFVGLADRLGIDVRTLLKEDVRFHELEAAGHALGRAVAQATTERLAFTRAERLREPQPCPICGRLCPLSHRDRPLESIDGPLELHEPVCHSSACRRDFFPSTSCVGTRSAKL